MVSGTLIRKVCCTLFENLVLMLVYLGLQCAEDIKNEFDSRWSPHWHVIIGRNFGSFITHEVKCFVFFYLEDKAVMLFKAG